MKKENVLVLGASDKPDRYSYKAFHLLKQYGHNPILINPTLKEVEGTKCFPDIAAALKENPIIDTITMYINDEKSNKVIEAMIKAKPKRVIFNPGSENNAIYDKLEQNGIESEEACTLVLLRTNQY